MISLVHVCLVCSWWLVVTFCTNSFGCMGDATRFTTTLSMKAIILVAKYMFWHYWNLKAEDQEVSIDHYSTTAIACSGTFGHGEYLVTGSSRHTQKPYWWILVHAMIKTTCCSCIPSLIATSNFIDGWKQPKTLFIFSVQNNTHPLDPVCNCSLATLYFIQEQTTVAISLLQWMSYYNWFWPSK